MKRKKLTALLMAAAMAFTMLAGCGNDDGKTPSDSVGGG